MSASFITELAGKEQSRSIALGLPRLSVLMEGFELLPILALLVKVALRAGLKPRTQLRTALVSDSQLSVRTFP
jgi:hypothetical protein